MILSKIFSKAATDLVREVGGVADNFITTDKEKGAFKNAISELVMTRLNELAAMQSEVLKTEMSGNQLQRNWRPVIMLMFGWVIFYYYFMAPVFGLPGIDLPDRFWGLLEIGLGGYVVGRSVEKVADTVTRNVDLTFLKKKDRKEAME